MSVFLISLFAEIILDLISMIGVWEKEKSYVPQYMVDEINGIAAGICAKVDLLNPALAGAPGCNVTEWSEKIQQVNMLPELIRMACTAYGAWGNATASSSHPGGLLQLRALDFGSGPFANYSVLQVHRSSAKRNPTMQAFASLSFPGFVGEIVFANRITKLLVLYYYNDITCQIIR
jgi:hypothetical protein